MGKKVIVTVTSKQKIYNEEEVIELVTPGKFYKKGDAYFIIYDETEISGMEGTTTTVKIESESVNLIRFGSTTTNLVFKKGEKNTSLYRTPYGILELTINPLQVKVDITEEGGEVRLQYELAAGGQQNSTNELLIKVH